MSLVRWRPTSSFHPRDWDIQNEVSRIFDHLLDRPFFDGDELRGIWSPSVDIAETENELICHSRPAGGQQGRYQGQCGGQCPDLQR